MESGNPMKKNNFKKAAEKMEPERTSAVQKITANY